MTNLSTQVSQVITYLYPEDCAACETSSHRTSPYLRGPIPKPLPPGKGLTYDLKVSKYGSFANAKLKSLYKYLWHRIISTSSPGVATQYPADCKVGALKWPVFTEGLKCVLRACRRKTAAWRFQRGNTYLIESYQDYEWENGNFLNRLQYCFTLHCLYDILPLEETC